MKLTWLVKLSWPALQHQAGRQLLALVAIALGVALSYAVHLLNTTALAEFGSAAASLNGQPDLVLRARSGPMADSAYADVAALPVEGGGVVHHEENFQNLTQGDFGWVVAQLHDLVAVGCDQPGTVANARWRC